jgi:glycosyltransferase involved in cell wall biosynthesis
MCEALASKGHEVTLFTTNKSVRGSWIPGRGTEEDLSRVGGPDVRNGVRIQCFAVRWPARFGYAPDMGAELRRRIHEFDVVHIHSLYLHPTLAAGRACIAAGVPYLVRPHGTLDPWLRQRHRFRKAVYGALFERRILDSAAAIHYTSQDEMELAGALDIRAPGVVVPLGVDSHEYANLPNRGAFRARYRDLVDRRLILFLGRITPKKGLDLLIRSFATVHKEQPDARLVIAGPDDDGYGNQVRAEIRAHQVDAYVTFAGMVLGQQKLELLADADVWVLPSYTENFGLGVLEALACGLPTIISDRVNIHRELASAGAALVTGCNESEVSQAVLRILREPRLAAKLGRAGRKLAASLSWTQTAARLILVYERLVAGLSPVDQTQVVVTDPTRAEV